MITYVPEDDTDVVILDTVPAEWHVTAIENDPTDLPVDCGESTSLDANANDGDYVTVSRGGKSGKNCRSANKIEWTPDIYEAVSTLLVDVTTRINPGKGHAKLGHGGDIFSPTSCGPLFLNEGATAFEIDENGDIVFDEGDPVIVAGPTPPLCLAAVEDPGTEEGDGGPEADHDGDGIASFLEACVNEVRTDPCRIDTDLDSVNDGVGNLCDQCLGTDDPDCADVNGCGLDEPVTGTGSD